MGDGETDGSDGHEIDRKKNKKNDQIEREMDKKETDRQTDGWMDWLGWIDG